PPPHPSDDASAAPAPQEHQQHANEPTTPTGTDAERGGLATDDDHGPLPHLPNPNTSATPPPPGRATGNAENKPGSRQPVGSLETERPKTESESTGASEDEAAGLRHGLPRKTSGQYEPDSAEPQTQPRMQPPVSKEWEALARRLAALRDPAPSGGDVPTPLQQEPVSPGEPGGDGSGGKAPEKQPSAASKSERDAELDKLSADDYEKLLYKTRQRFPRATEETILDEAYAHLKGDSEKVVKSAEPGGEREIALEKGPTPPDWKTQDLVKFDDESELPRSLEGFGHSKVTFRGLDLLGDDLKAALKPAAGEFAELERELMNNPHTFVDGRPFTFRAEDGGYRQVTLTVRNFGNWSRYTEPPKTPEAAEGEAAPEKKADEDTEGKTEGQTEEKAEEKAGEKSGEKAEEQTKQEKPESGQETKVDTEIRSRPGAGDSKTLGANRSYGASVPLGPAAGFASPYGSIGFSVRRMEPSYSYGTENRAQTSMTSVGKDSSHVHVDDLHITVETKSWDKNHNEITPERAGVPEKSTYAVRGGLMWRAPDSITHPVRPDRLPSAFTFAPGDRPRLYSPVSVDTDQHLLAWALQAFPEAKPGTAAHEDITAFVSPESLRTLLGPATTSTAMSQALFAGLGGQRSLGAIELKLEPVSAKLSTASDKSEVKKADANRMTATVERRSAQGGTVTATLGPAFSPLGDSRLKAQAAAVASVSSQRSESSTSGNNVESGRTLNSRGHAGLYDVAYRLKVRKLGGEWASPHPEGLPYQISAKLLMSRAEARRLAGWDDGTKLAEDAPAPKPPAYLLENDPVTFGPHAVVELDSGPGGGSSRDAAHRQKEGQDGQDAAAATSASLVEKVRDQMHRRLYEEYPELVLSPDEHTPQRFRYVKDAETGELVPKRFAGRAQDYANALRNTHKLHQALSQVQVESGLEALTSTGVSFELERLGQLYDGDLRPLDKEYVSVTLKATAANLRFDGVAHDLGQANNLASMRHGDSASTRTQGFAAGFDLGVSGGGDLGASAGFSARYGWSTSYGTTYGPMAATDGGVTSTGPQHLWTYDLQFHATATSFRRPRQAARVLSGQLMSLPWFVRPSEPIALLGSEPERFAGHVTIAVPAALSPTHAHPRPTAERKEQEAQPQEVPLG
ncbi:hypothetical protein ADK38_16820, partial [Streptomyces varsoviensis]